MKKKKSKKKIKKKAHAATYHDEYVPVDPRELVQGLNEDLQDAFETLRLRAAEFGEQRTYNSARAHMFARRVCYMFVRPKKSYLELCFFLPNRLNDTAIYRVTEVSKTKFAHTYKLIHSDQLEEPLTDWLREAYAHST